jgi:hypothetical protein
MLACFCFGIGEAIFLFFAGLFGLCKICTKKHLRQGRKVCHDHCTDCKKEIIPDETWRCSNGKEGCGQDRCFDCHDEHVNERMRQQVTEETLRTGKVIVVQDDDLPDGEA